MIAACGTSQDSEHGNKLLTPADVWGTYRHDYSYGYARTGYIIIREDGSYFCKLVGTDDLTLFTDTEKYQFDENDTSTYPGENCIHFDNYCIYLMEGWGENGKPLSEFPAPFNRSLHHNGGVTLPIKKSINGETLLAFDEDVGLVYRRISTEQDTQR